MEGPQLVCAPGAFSLKRVSVIAVIFAGVAVKVAAHLLLRSLLIKIREPDASLGKMRASRASGGSCGMFSSCAACVDCRVDPSGGSTEMQGLVTCSVMLRGAWLVMK